MRSRAAARAAAPYENVGGVRVERGGKHGYKHVRGGQGRDENMIQGTTPRKIHRTSLFHTPKEAAVAFAKKLFVGAGMKDAAAQQQAAALALAPMGAAHAASLRMTLALGEPLARGVPIPSVHAVLLTREQAAAAAARGVPLALAE